MPASYYRSLLTVAASLSLLASGCTATRVAQEDAVAAQLPQTSQEASVVPEGEMDTEATIWTVLGIAKKPSKEVGPRTGAGVSSVLWQATLDTLGFVQLESVDPMAGLVVTNWYSPKNKPAERLRVTAFIKARALRSDSVVVTVERQTRAADGQWKDDTVAAEVASNLENDILQRARQIHIARIRSEQ
jgi:hypothetical protein